MTSRTPMCEETRPHSVSAFYIAYRDEFPVGMWPTLRAFKTAVSRRQVNGLKESSAVLEAGVGLVVIPEMFFRWMARKRNREAA
jgi:hypothetical protein